MRQRNRPCVNTGDYDRQRLRAHPFLESLSNEEGGRIPRDVGDQVTRITACLNVGLFLFLNPSAIKIALGLFNPPHAFGALPDHELCRSQQGGNRSA